MATDNNASIFQLLPDVDVMNTPITVTVSQLDALANTVSDLDSCCCDAGVDLEQKIELIGQLHDQIIDILGEHVDLVYAPEEVPCAEPPLRGMGDAPEDREA